MATEQRLRWGGNQQAQQEADRAWNDFRHKAAKKKLDAKLNRPPKKLSKAQRRKNRKMGLTADGKPKHFQERQQFKRPDYYVYIASKRWAKRREQYYANHGKQCEVCGSTEGVQLHHRHYRTLGRERDKDLQALCGGCHSNEHEGNVRGVVDPMTAEFLSLKL